MLERERYLVPSAEILPFGMEGILCESGTNESFDESSDYDGSSSWE